MALTDGLNMGIESESELITKAKHTSEMSLSDIQKVFKEDFSDEIHDSNKYCDMAKAAEEAGNLGLAKGLHAMAYDEYTHAKFIHENLVDWGCEIPEKEMMAWQQLKERVARSFR